MGLAGRLEETLEELEKDQTFESSLSELKDAVQMFEKLVEDGWAKHRGNMTMPVDKRVPWNDIPANTPLVDESVPHWRPPRVL